MAVFRDLWAPPLLVAVHHLTVAPHVRGELERWRRRARTIPDRDLRRLALAKLEGEHLNAQAAAVFATLVPLRHRSACARLMVAFEVMYDYLDAVSEQPARDPVRNGLRLHEAAAEAVATGPRAGLDFYAFGGYAGDGGYLRELSAVCRRRLAALPAASLVRPALRRSVARCAEGQSRTHAVDQIGVGQMRGWAASLAGGNEYEWWELTAGAASSLAIHALFAAAGDDRTTAADAERIDAAHFPSVCALSTLLDAFVDRSSDAASGVHNYIDYYGESADVAGRLGAIANNADQAARRLSHGHRRAAIVAGVVAFYLSSEAAAESGSADAARIVIEGLPRPMILPLLAAVHWKRRFGGG